MDLRRSINTKIWDDVWFSELNQSEKILWLYLLTNPLTNMLGVYEISEKKISFDTGLSLETIRKAFEAFQRLRKAKYIEGYVILFNWIKNQSFNPNMMKSAIKDFKNLPNNIKFGIYDIIRNELILKNETLSKPLKSFEILPKKEKEKEKEIEKEIEIEIENEQTLPEEKFVFEPPQENERVAKAIKIISQFFGISEINHANSHNQISNFVRYNFEKGKMDYLANQFTAYMELKKDTPNFKHGWKKYIGSPEKSYEDGAWNEKNWEIELNLKKTDNTNGNESKIKKSIQRTKELLEEARKQHQ
jgi:hypothetical protein